MSHEFIYSICDRFHLNFVSDFLINIPDAEYSDIADQFNICICAYNDEEEISEGRDEIKRKIFFPISREDVDIICILALPLIERNPPPDKQHIRNEYYEHCDIVVVEVSRKERISVYVVHYQYYYGSLNQVIGDEKDDNYVPPQQSSRIQIDGRHVMRDYLEDFLSSCQFFWFLKISRIIYF